MVRLLVVLAAGCARPYKLPVVRHTDRLQLSVMQVVLCGVWL